MAPSTHTTLCALEPMNRIHELVEAVQEKYPQDPFFKDFRESCKSRPERRADYRTYDDAFELLDERSWRVLKGKAVAHFSDCRPGQLKQGFFSQLNEAFAYRSLVRRGYSNVELLAELGRCTPDIRYVDAGQLKHREVKTLGRSDAEIARRASRQSGSNTYFRLTAGWFRKLASTVANARSQVAEQRTPGVVYLVVLFDDGALDYYEDYRRQIISFSRSNDLGDVYIKVGLRGNRRITFGCTRRHAPMERAGARRG